MPEHANAALIMAAAKMESAAALLDDAAKRLEQLNQSTTQVETIRIKTLKLGLNALEIAAKQT